MLWNLVEVAGIGNVVSLVLSGKASTWCRLTSLQSRNVGAVSTVIGPTVFNMDYLWNVVIVVSGDLDWEFQWTVACVDGGSCQVDGVWTLACVDGGPCQVDGVWTLARVDGGTCQVDGCGRVANVGPLWNSHMSC